MKINLYGYGFVGKAHHNMLSQHYDINIIDPTYPDLEKTDFNPDCSIVCVSTPQKDDGRCDMSNVLDVFSKIDANTPVLIKSTISLEGWKDIKSTYPHHSVNFSPEFLRQDHYLEDFKSLSMIYLSEERAQWWAKLFNPCWKDIQFVVGRADELILVKYFRNSYHAAKVAFFNQVYDLCEATGISFEEVRHGICFDPRIGFSHSIVTEERGFGGHCLPKDSSAIIQTAEDYNVDLSVIKEARNYNFKVRKTLTS